MNAVSLGEIVTDLLEDAWRFDPVAATRQGVHRYDRLLPTFTPDAVDGWAQRLRSHRRRLEALDVGALSRSEQLDRRWALAVLERLTLDCDLRLWERSPQAHILPLGSAFHDLLVDDSRPPLDRGDALLARLQAVPAYLQAARVTLRPRDVPPPWVDYARRTARAVERFLAELDAAAVLGQAAWDRHGVPAQRRALQAVADFQGFLEDVGAVAQGIFAIGRERYDHLLARYHLLSVDADQLADFGRAQMERYLAEMAAVARSLDPSASWVEVLERVKDNHPAPDRLRDAYDRETALARRHCLECDLVTFPPEESYQVEWMPPFLRSTYPIALPWTPPIFGTGTRTRWYVTPVDPTAPAEVRRQHLRDNSWAWIRSIAMHEMYPGHHLHKVIAKDVATPLRKQWWSPVYTEGWGLYTEELFWETGLLADPRLRLMQLRNGLWRSVRVIVDTGLHARGMAFAEAVSWLVEHARLEPRWAESETRLYTTMPTYPSAYLVGMHAILRLRERARAAWPRFSLKAFHDALLRYSTLPLALIEEDVLAGGPAPA